MENIQCLKSFKDSFHLWKDQDGDFHAIFMEQDSEGKIVKQNSVEICCTSGGNWEIYRTLEKLDELIQKHGFPLK